MRPSALLLLATIATLTAACGSDASEEPTTPPISCADGERYSPISDRCEPIPTNNGQDMTATPDMTAMMDMTATPDMTEPAQDMATTPDMMSTPDMTVAMDMPPQQDMPSGTSATLRGTITRSAMPQNGGVGGLYVAIFERNPIMDRNNAGLVGRTLIENADMRAANASFMYRIEDIPPRQEPYYVIAFLDDNNTVSMNNPDAAGPDRGDLVSINGFNPPTVTLAQAGEQTLDLVLSFALPF